MRSFNHNCRYKCIETISEQERQTLFTEYWALGSWDLQTAFIFQMFNLVELQLRNPRVVYRQEISVANQHLKIKYLNIRYSLSRSTFSLFQSMFLITIGFTVPRRSSFQKALIFQ
ncbi:hypothetical protein PR048_032955 [Dryococelus australis]|uniref:Uncharacterized protein n=1 Tax=Dryococelus australis TaxID=614101 RepID=A0ABQ9G4G5_9NEOP|nr:hypothetical protein PR048_032955 [Dryococelus australis]